MSLSVELVTIGDELLSGRTLDANGPYLAQRGTQLGVPLMRQQVVGDELEEIQRALASAAKRSQIVVCSGGLGPTPDDRTKNALASLLDVPLQKNTEAIEILKTHYSRIGKEWQTNLNSYQMIPEGVTPLENPNGLAPGLLADFNQAKILFLAGPPREFKAMLDLHLPQIISALPDSPLKKEQFSIRTYGIPEEKIFGELCPGLWEKLEEHGKLSSLPTLAGVDLIIESKSELKPLERSKWINEIKESLGQTKLPEYIWQFGEQSLPDFLLSRLRENKLTLSMAESCTGGLASSMITDISGCSDVFIGSIISYANQVKTEILGVKNKTLEEHGAVSLEAVKEMAEGARIKMNTDIALAFSGVAGPTGGSVDKPVGTLSLGLSTRWGETQAQVLRLRGERVVLKQRFATKGFQWVIQELNHQFPTPSK